MRVTPVDRDEVRRRWRSATPAPAPQRPKIPQNLRSVIELGDTVYIHFRGRQYGVPPVPYAEGQRVLDAYLRAKDCGEELSSEKLPQYRQAIEDLARLLPKLLRSGGSPIRRALFRIGFFNPIREATEADILALAGFLLGLRMKSSGIVLVERPGPRI
jgi:hypothetical protein